MATYPGESNYPSTAIEGSLFGIGEEFRWSIETEMLDGKCISNGVGLTTGFPDADTMVLEPVLGLSHTFYILNLNDLSYLYCPDYLENNLVWASEVTIRNIENVAASALWQLDLQEEGDDKYYHIRLYLEDHEQYLIAGKEETEGSTVDSPQTYAKARSDSHTGKNKRKWIFVTSDGSGRRVGNI
jgi:hypothetical protein